MKNKLWLLILPGFLLMSAANANDKSYYPPQVLKNCHLESQIPRCDQVDNDFLRLLYSSTEGLDGDYIFDHATASDSTDPYYTAGYFVDYYYKNSKGNKLRLWGVYSNSMSPDRKASGNTWIEVPDPKRTNYKCTGNTVNCPYTHTPWMPSINLNQPGHTYSKARQLSLNKINHFMLKSKHPTTCYSFRNETDFPITLRKSDYNMIDFQFAKTVVPPHSNEIIIKDLPEGDQPILMFNIQVGDGERNTENTANLLAAGDSSIGYATFGSGFYDLWVHNQWIDLGSDFEQNGNCLKLYAHRIG